MNVASNRPDHSQKYDQKKLIPDSVSSNQPSPFAYSAPVYEKSVEPSYGSFESFGSFQDSVEDKDEKFNAFANSLKKQDIYLSRQYSKSAWVIYFCVFSSEMARGILFPTLWLFVSSMGGSKSFQGFVVSSFSLGRIVSAPYFGHLSEHYGHQLALILCNLVLIIGAILYSLAPSLYFIIFAQFVIGLGAGSLGVTRSFVAETTPSIRRTEYLAYLTALQYAGFTVTPVLGAVLSSLFQSSNALAITKYSAPAYFLVLMAVLSIVLLLFFFQNIDPAHNISPAYLLWKPTSTKKKNPTKEEELSLLKSSSTSDDEEDLFPHEEVLFTEKEKEEMYYKNHQQKEEIKEEIATIDEISAKKQDNRMEEEFENEVDSVDDQPHQAQYQAKKPTSLFYFWSIDENNSMEREKWRNFILYFGMIVNLLMKGSIGIFETILIIMTIHFYHWNSLQTGFIISFLGFMGVIILCNFAFLLKIWKDFQLIPIGLIFMILSSFLLSFPATTFTTSSHSHVDEDHERWKTVCLIISLVCMLTVGYPIGHTTLIGLYSRLLNHPDGKQGKSLGLFASVGSLARIIFPIVAGLLMDYWGNRFQRIFLLLGIMLMGTLLAYWQVQSLIEKLLL